MSWLNLNESFNSLKGQITNFASEVLSEVPEQDSTDNASRVDPPVSELEEKCRNQELEIASLKKLNDELQASLQSERLTKQNGVKEDEGSWYWDPPPQTKLDDDLESQYKVQIRTLQNEISTLRERNTIDLRPDDELTRLREENQNLTTNLEDLDTQHQQAMERLLSLKKELHKNFEVLKQDHEDLKASNDEYAAEIKMLLEKIGERDREIENMKGLKSDYDTLHHKYVNLERVYGVLRENAEKFQEENQDLHEEVFKLQEQVTKMEHDLEVSAKTVELSETVPKQQYEEVLKELNDVKDRRNANLMQLDEINIDDNAKSVIENLKRDITKLKHELSLRDGEDGHKMVKPEKIMQLYNKYVNFDIPLDYVGEMPTGHDNVVLFKLESVFKTVNSFKKDIDLLEHQLSEKKLNINHLQTQIEDLTAENDFLTTDIQHFEQELNEMKKNNDFLISELTVLKNASKLQPIIETHEDNLAKLETELDACNNMNKTFESEIKRIEKELEEVNSEKKILQESLNDLKTKYTTMLSEVEMCKNKTEEVEDLETTAHVQEIEKLKKVAHEIDDLKKQLNMANSKNEQMSIDIHIIENDKVLLTKQIDDLKNALSEKTSSHLELEAIKLAMENKLKDFDRKLEEILQHKKEIETEKHNLLEKVTVLESQVANNASEIDRLTADKNNLSQKLNQVAKENATLVSQIQSLQSREQDLVTQNNNLKANSKAKGDVSDTKDPCVVKIIQQDLYKEITTLKEENNKLNTRNAQLEEEISSTDAKIIHLDVEFNKLTADINEKDELIDELNNAMKNYEIQVFNLNNTVSELETSIQVKNAELERLRDSNADLSNQMVNLHEKYNHNDEEFNNKNSNELIKIKEELIAKNNELTNLAHELEQVEKIRNEFQSTITIKENEITQLKQSINELTERLQTNSHINKDFVNIVEEKDTIVKEVYELKNSLTQKDNEITELKEKLEDLVKQVAEYNINQEKATTEKAELINLINLKHNESIQYHNEIQRLNHVLLEQANEFKKELEKRHVNKENCNNCERLNITLKEKDEIIISLNNNTMEYERIKLELNNATEVVNNLTEKCDALDKHLNTQLEMVKKLTTENGQLSEQYENSTRELERLRRHLVETEENYTQELMTCEQKLTECQTRLHSVEERAKQTSTVYTSNSIRANQEVETLRNQIRLLEKQREEVQARLSEAEDARSRSEAALTNLQIVLEQFQLDKDRDIETATEKIKNKMADMKCQNDTLTAEINRLNAKLEESVAGLQAANRLGDQLESKTALINDLKEQVRTLQTSVQAAEERYYNAISNQQDKVDKNLVKNLIINYVMTTGNNTNKTQVLRILSTVLDFNQQECTRLGLVKSQAPDSLAAEFVRFLENESKPRAPLPNMMGLTSRSSTPVSRKSSNAGPQPDLTHKRNPSTGSNNLLFTSIDKLETSSQASQISTEQTDTRARQTLDTGVTQTRNNEGAILKHVLRDM